MKKNTKNHRPVVWLAHTIGHLSAGACWEMARRHEEQIGTAANAASNTDPRGVVLLLSGADGLARAVAGELGIGLTRETVLAVAVDLDRAWEAYSAAGGPARCEGPVSADDNIMRRAWEQGEDVGRAPRGETGIGVVVIAYQGVAILRSDMFDHLEQIEHFDHFDADVSDALDALGDALEAPPPAPAAPAALVVRDATAAEGRAVADVPRAKVAKPRRKAAAA